MNGNQILKSRPTGSQVTVGREVSSLAASLLATADGVTTRRLRIRDSRKDAACKLHLRQAREKWVLDAEAAQPQAKEEAETAALEKTKLWEVLYGLALLPVALPLVLGFALYEAFTEPSAIQRPTLGVSQDKEEKEEEPRVASRRPVGRQARQVDLGQAQSLVCRANRSLSASTGQRALPGSGA